MDIEKILAALTANGFGIIGGDMTPGNGTGDPKDNGGGKNGSITTIHNEEVVSIIFLAKTFMKKYLTLQNINYLDY